MSITGNDERDRLLFAAMKTAMSNGQPLSLDNVKALLPQDFDLLPSELVQARHAAKLEPAPLVARTPDGRPLAPEPQAVAPEPPQPEPEPEAVPGPEVRLTQMQARHAVESAAKRADLARLAVRMTRAALNEQRGKLGKAIEAWQNGGPKWTPEMERKAMLATYAANRGSGPRMNTRKHPAQVVIQGRGVVSGYKGNRRNALPSEYQHRNVARPGLFQGAPAKKV